MTNNGSSAPPPETPPYSGLQWEPTTGEGADRSHPFSTASDRRYVTGAELGRGGMGKVLAARDDRLRRQVAIKEIAVGAGEEAARRLAQEAWITAQLDHPNIISVYDAGQTEDGRLFYVMRLVRGQTLAEAITAAGAGDADKRRELLRHFLAACQAMAYAHNMGIIHRDIKPSNVLVGRFGETQVMDWGLARPITRAEDSDWAAVVPSGHVAETQQGVAVGTPRYMSPEQAGGGGVDPRSDVWSLGVVLYEILTGRPPFGGDTPQEVIEKVVTQPPPLAEGAPPELAAIVRRALEREPAARYPHAGALADDVARFLDGRLVGVYQYPPLVMLRRLLSAWRLPVGVALLAGIAAAALIFSAWQSALRAQEEAQAAQARSDERLQHALVTQARAALSVQAGAEAEVLAARALQLGDAPEAWGVLAGFAAAPRPLLRDSQPKPAGCLHEAMSADGSAFLCVGEEEMSLWRGQPLIARWQRPAPDGVAMVTLNGDGSAGIIGLRTQDVWQVSGQDGTLQLLPQGSRAHGWMSMSHATRWAAAHHQGGGYTYDLEARVQTEQPCPAPSRMGTIAVSAPGTLARLCDRGPLVLIDLHGEAPPREVPTRITLEASADTPGAWTSAFSSNGAWLVVGSLSGRVELVDVAAGQSVALAEMGEGMTRAVAVSDDGQTVVAATERGGTRLWAPMRSDTMLRLPGYHSVLRLSPDGDLIAVGEAVQRWALPPWELLWKIDAGSGVSAVSVSPDGKSLGVATGADAQVWSLETGQRRARWQGDPPEVTKDIDFSADSTVALIGSMAQKGLARLRVSDGATLPPLTTTRGSMRRLGRLGPGWLWSLAWNRSPILWDPDGQADERLVLPGIVIYEGESSSDGRFAVLVGDDRGVYRLEAGPPAQIERLLRDVDAIAADISEDGQRIALTNRTAIWVYDLVEEATVWTLPSPERVSLDVAFSPDSRRLAVGDLTGSVRLLDAADGTLLATLRGHSERVSSIAFTPDGRHLVSGSWDDTVRVWGLDVLGQDPARLAEEVQAAWGMTLEEALASDVW